jgi:rare lipoprotein A
VAAANGGPPSTPRERERMRMSVRLAGRMAALAFVALATANCATPVPTTGGKSGNKYGVAASPKVIPDGQPIPKGGGREMVGKPYVVGERTYVPHDGKGYAREGEASWYGTAFHGRLTANGEVFDKESIAAAHPTLPLPSYVRVTNLNNRRSMIVRVNDRGPYERGRLIDLSERAADALEFRRAGTTKVRVEYVGRASVKGSDDRKLMATLRTDGAPAAIGSRGPVMLASLDERGPNAQPLAFKPGPLQLASKPRDADAEDTTPAIRPAPVVMASRDLGPAPRLQATAPRERILEEAAPARSSRSRPPEPIVDKAGATQVGDRSPARSLHLAIARGAPHPAPPGQRPQLAAASKPLPAGANALPPGRPAMVNVDARSSAGKPQTKVAEKADPAAKPARQRVVSLKGTDASVR